MNEKTAGRLLYDGARDDCPYRSDRDVKIPRKTGEPAKVAKSAPFSGPESRNRQSAT